MLSTSETYEADLAAAENLIICAEVALAAKAAGAAGFLRTHAATVSVETIVLIADELDQAVAALSRAKGARLDVIFSSAEVL